jgi:hypothetical protein
MTGGTEGRGPTRTDSKRWASRPTLRFLAKQETIVLNLPSLVDREREMPVGSLSPGHGWLERAALTFVRNAVLGRGLPLAARLT